MLGWTAEPAPLPSDRSQLKGALGPQMNSIRINVKNDFLLAGVGVGKLPMTEETWEEEDTEETGETEEVEAEEEKTEEAGDRKDMGDRIGSSDRPAKERQESDEIKETEKTK